MSLRPLALGASRYHIYTHTPSSSSSSSSSSAPCPLPQLPFRALQLHTTPSRSVKRQQHEFNFTLPIIGRDGRPIPADKTEQARRKIIASRTMTSAQKAAELKLLARANVRTKSGAGARGSRALPTDFQPRKPRWQDLPRPGEVVYPKARPMGSHVDEEARSGRQKARGQSRVRFGLADPSRDRVGDTMWSGSESNAFVDRYSPAPHARYPTSAGDSEIEQGSSGSPDHNRVGSNTMNTTSAGRLAEYDRVRDGRRGWRQKADEAASSFSHDRENDHHAPPLPFRRRTITTSNEGQSRQPGSGLGRGERRESSSGNTSQSAMARSMRGLSSHADTYNPHDTPPARTNHTDTHLNPQLPNPQNLFAKQRSDPRSTTTPPSPPGSSATSPPASPPAEPPTDTPQQRWEPTKKLTFAAMDALRELHRSDPRTYTKDALSEKFGISYEAVNRILRSKFVRDPPKAGGGGDTEGGRWRRDRPPEMTPAEHVQRAFEHRRSVATRHA